MILILDTKTLKSMTITPEDFAFILHGLQASGIATQSDKNLSRTYFSLRKRLEKGLKE